MALAALTSTTVVGAQPLRFDRITADDGLIQTQINALLQDRQGFLWIGTIEGLHRFDGVRFTTWRKSDQVALPSNDVRSLLEDREGHLWIGGTSGGLSRFDPRTQTFELFAPDATDPGSLANGRVIALWQDAFGSIWIGTDGGGLDRLDPTSGRFIHYRERLAGLAEDFDPGVIRDLAGDDEGNLYVATLEGLVRLEVSELGDELRPVAGEVFRHAPDDPNSPLSDRLYALTFDDQGSLWLGSDLGIDRFDPREGRFEHFRQDSELAKGVSTPRVRSLLWTGEGLWVGTGRGLDFFDPATRSFRHHRHSQPDTTTLSDDRILALFEDASGLLWVGTRVGLNKLNPLSSQFGGIAPDPDRPDDSLRGHRIRSVLEDRDGTVWIGTRQGLTALDRTKGRTRHWSHDPEDARSLGHDDVTALYEDHPGDLWLGSPWSGLSRLDRATGTFRHWRHDSNDPSSLPSDDVLAIIEDGEQHLWIGTYGGLSRFDRTSEGFRNFRHDPDDPTSIGSSMVMTLYTHPDGSLWVGTFATEANRFDEATQSFERYTLLPDIAGGGDGAIHAFYADTPGSIWITSWGNGLYHLDIETGTTERFSQDDGLVSNNIYGLLGDESGHLWVSTTQGLSRLDPGDRSVLNFTEADGLPSSQFSIHAAYRGRDELFFGGINGLVVVEPGAIRENLRIPETVLATITIPNRKTGLGVAPSFLDELRLGPEENWLALGFAALDFVAPERNQYRYTFQRVGEPEQWTHLGTQGNITFSDLAPGDYVLRAQGSNSRGAWDPEGVRLAIHVAAPYWQTPWFRLLLALGVVGLIFLFFELRTLSIREHASRLQTEIVERQKTEAERERLIEELEAKNTELERFNYTASHDLKAPLVTIRGFLGFLEKDAVSGNLDRLRRDVERIAKAVDTMQTLLDELLRYSRAGLQTRVFGAVSLFELAEESAALVVTGLGDRPIEIEITPRLPEVWGDRIRLLQVFLNLMGNAAKFMGAQTAPRIEIGVAETDAEYVVIFVRDNGIGIDPQHHEEIFGLFNRLATHTEGTGVGLALVRRIVEQHGGSIWLESEGEGRGSTFFVRLPTPRHDGSPG